MAYTLTFGEGIHCRVNGITSDYDIVSPYTLKNGDSVYMYSDVTKFTINDELYEDANENVVNISDKDIVIAASGRIPSMASGYNTVIHFSAAETPKALSFGGKILRTPSGKILYSGHSASTVGGYTLTVTAFRGSFNITYADGSTTDVEDGVYSNVKQINSYVFEDEGDRSWNINGSQPALPYALTADSTAYVYSACIIEGTFVTLADGTAKPIENITYDDDLLVWNFYEGKFDHAKPIWVKPVGVVPEYNLCKFDNGAEVGLVGPGIYHRIYNNEAHEFTHTGSEDTPIGTTTFTDYGGFTKLVSQEIVRKTVRYYNVITDKHYNIFANGILTSSRISNRYGIENDMRYNLTDVRMAESEVESYIAKLPR